MFERCTVYLHRTFKDFARCGRTRVERNSRTCVKERFFFFFEGATSYPAFVYLCLPSEAHRATSISDFNISIASSRRLYRDHKNCNCHGQRINFKRNLGVVIGLLKTKCPDMSAPRRNNLQRIEQIQIAYGVHVEQTIV